MSADREGDERPGPARASADSLLELAGRVREIGRENERLFARLSEGERRFRGLARAVWKVQEDERRRLARELHDGLGQTLTALTHQIERLRLQAEEEGFHELGPRLADTVETVRLALEESRELSRLLRPAVLDDLGLEAALTALARSLGRRAGLRVELELSGFAERLPAEVETLVFRLVQESLTNVLRHARTEVASVRLVHAGGWVRLEVADRGCGFAVESVLGGSGEGEGSGLRGMRDRLELFGGRLRVRSVPGEGTTVAAAVPCDEAR